MLCWYKVFSVTVIFYPSCNLTMGEETQCKYTLDVFIQNCFQQNYFLFEKSLDSSWVNNLSRKINYSRSYFVDFSFEGSKWSSFCWTERILKWFWWVSGFSPVQCDGVLVLMMVWLPRRLPILCWLEGELPERPIAW